MNVLQPLLVDSWNSGDLLLEFAGLGSTAEGSMVRRLTLLQTQKIGVASKWTLTGKSGICSIVLFRRLLSWW